MARINTEWFEFIEKSSKDMGVKIVDPPISSSGERRGTQQGVSGKNGYVWISDGTRKEFEIKRTCRVRQSNKRAVQAWLSGSGMLRFSTENDAQYSARIIKKIDFKFICPGADPLYEFTVTFTCQPDPYIYPEADIFIASTSGAVLPTPEYAYAIPRIEIIGSGDFSLTIGMQTLNFIGVENGIIVDSELGDALSLDGASLANDKIDGDLFEIQPGQNTVSWLTGGEGTTGSVSQVKITPRWRYI